MAKQWYVLRVQTSREDQVKDSIERRARAEGLDYQFGQILVPSEKYSEIRAGQKSVRERRIYPGYVMVEMELNEQTAYLVRETPGVGDFLGTGRTPVALETKEVEKMQMEAEREHAEPTPEIRFRPGDKVRIKEGAFQSFPGTIEEVSPEKGQVRVIVTIFGRGTPIDLESWQIESI
jgi:transcriptional antiterminator NusG